MQHCGVLNLYKGKLQLPIKLNRKLAMHMLLIFSLPHPFSERYLTPITFRFASCLWIWRWKSFDSAPGQLGDNLNILFLPQISPSYVESNIVRYGNQAVYPTPKWFNQLKPFPMYFLRNFWKPSQITRKESIALKTLELRNFCRGFAWRGLIFFSFKKIVWDYAFHCNHVFWTVYLLEYGHALDYVYY